MKTLKDIIKEVEVDAQSTRQLNFNNGISNLERNLRQSAIEDIKDLESEIKFSKDRIHQAEVQHR
jgi:hypothetical protein